MNDWHGCDGCDDDDDDVAANVFDGGGDGSGGGGGNELAMVTDRSAANLCM